MGDVAASGGYYIAAPADVIVAQPGTITGSIGVVTGKFVLGGTADKLGLGTGSVSEGKMAEIYSPFKPFSAEERARISEQMQSTYSSSCHASPRDVIRRREKINSVAQGRVWTGQQGRDLGLVDELGGLERALQVAKQRAKIDATKARRSRDLSGQTHALRSAVEPARRLFRAGTLDFLPAPRPARL